MRNTLHTAAGLCLFHTLLLLSAEGYGQTPFGPEYRDAGALIVDHLEVFTDRTIYVAGEPIRFRAEYFNEGLPGDLPWSSVVYVELIAPDGSPVVHSKWAIHDRTASGTLTIPGEVLTGRYMLRCYTRWMRNRGPGTYNHTPLTIINPFSRQVADTGGTPGQASGLPPESVHEESPGAIQCSADKAEYLPGEWVRITLQAPEGSLPEGFGSALTVAPEGSVDPPEGLRLVGRLPVASDSFQLLYLPDLGESFTLSGMMVAGGGRPVADGALSFSLLGPEPDLITANTGPQGRFAVQIPLPKSGQAFLVTPYPGEDDSLTVRIDQDVDERKSPVMAGGFRMTAAEETVATLLAIRWQIMGSYREEDTSDTDTEIPLNRTLPFYGSDVERIELKEFVNLPTLEEIFINLVHGVNVIRRRGRVSISIEGDNRSLGFYRPLVLVDFVPVFDHNTLLALDPREFERIEVIREVYVKGGMAFGGVISLFTRNGDMAGLDLPEGSYFFDMTPLRDAEGGSVTGGGSAPASGERLPDLRNTVLWDPDLQLSPGSQKEMVFRAPDGPGTYAVRVWGALHPGSVLEGKTRFEVRGGRPSFRMP